MVVGSALEAIVSSPVALFFTAAAAVVALAVIRVLANTFHGARPPIFEGIPFVGGLMKFAGVRAAAANDHRAEAVLLCITTLLNDTRLLQGPWKLMHTGYEQLGEVFTVPVAHKRVTFLIGPDVAPHFFKATDDEMSQTEVTHIHSRPSPQQRSRGVESFNTTRCLATLTSRSNIHCTQHIHEHTALQRQLKLKSCLPALLSKPSAFLL